MLKLENNFFRPAKAYLLSVLYALCSVLLLSSCGGYKTPERGTWDTILRGASFGTMTETARRAKQPIYQGAGGRVLLPHEVGPYMDTLEEELTDNLRKFGIQISRVGDDVMVVIVRSAFMSADHPDISDEGVETLRTVSRALARFDRTWIEIAGYSDAMTDQNAATRFSFDMAERVALFLAQHRVKTLRMFVVGRGSARPIADQSSMGRQMNRRVELRISPIVK
ncbi:MAG: OmpA family protein [Alphaproteobacteria bacterium]|nr:OmpA family protein [Alphaproteobacteria bacterium]